MLGNAGVESVRGKEFGALNETEARLGNDEVKVAAFATDGTVTFMGFDISGRLHREFYPATVAPASMSDQALVHPCQLTKFAGNSPVSFNFGDRSV